MMDWRNLENGRTLPIQGAFADYPCVIEAQDGTWICAVTAGEGPEGAARQALWILRSRDQGQTWQDTRKVEPEEVFENCFGILYRTPYGRIYLLYCSNARHAVDIHIHAVKRYDMGGDFALRYSDDHGATWSQRRYLVPIRETEIDRRHAYANNGYKLRFFWSETHACKGPLGVYFQIYKYLPDFDREVLDESEGFSVCCENLDTERDPEKLRWLTLPEGEEGLRAPAGGGVVAEEQAMVCLSDGTLYAVYRTAAGAPAYARSLDGGRSFTAPQYLRYPDGRIVKHPRACTVLWSIGRGQFLYWFHNSAPLEATRRGCFRQRNPVWACVADEVPDTDGELTLAFSQPEILLYAPERLAGISYPELVEKDGAFFVTETEKKRVRLHPIDRTWLDILRGQRGRSALAEGAWGSQSLPETRFLAWNAAQAERLAPYKAAGLTLELELEEEAQGPLLRSGGIQVNGGTGGLELLLDDGNLESRCFCPGQGSHWVVILDGGSKTVSFVANGLLCDGGAAQTSGWRRFGAQTESLAGGPVWLAPGVKLLAAYPRALMITEAVGNARFRGFA